MISACKRFHPNYYGYFFENKAHRLAAVLAALVMAAGISMIGLSLIGTIPSQFLYVGIASIAADALIFGVILAVHHFRSKNASQAHRYVVKKPTHYARRTDGILGLNCQNKAFPPDANFVVAPLTDILRMGVFPYLDMESLWRASFTGRVWNQLAKSLKEQFVQRGDIRSPESKTQAFASFNLQADSNDLNADILLRSLYYPYDHWASYGNRLVLMNRQGKGSVFEANYSTRLLEQKGSFDLTPLMKPRVKKFRIHCLVKDLVYFEHDQYLYVYNLESGTLENRKPTRLVVETNMKVMFVSKDSIKFVDVRNMTGGDYSEPVRALYDFKGERRGSGLLINGKHQMEIQIQSKKYSLLDALQYKDKIVVFEGSYLTVIAKNNRIVLDNIHASETVLRPNGLLSILYYDSKLTTFHLIFNLETEKWLPYEFNNSGFAFKLGDLHVSMIDTGFLLFDAPEASALK